MVKHNNKLYVQVVELTNNYLGPASERFIERQIKTHIGKNPDEITREDVAKLDEWIKVALALLTDDEQLLQDFSNDLKQLASKEN